MLWVYSQKYTLLKYRTYCNIYRHLTKCQTGLIAPIFLSQAPADINCLRILFAADPGFELAFLAADKVLSTLSPNRCCGSASEGLGSGTKGFTTRCEAKLAKICAVNFLSPSPAFKKLFVSVATRLCIWLRLQTSYPLAKYNPQQN